jgi:predicted porin
MKKSLIALAVMAAAGAASAQSSVTLFGIVDAAVSRYSVSGGDRVTALANSGYNSSRLGFRGTEDLGGGLSASFWLEGALANDNGNAAGFNFQRRSTVSLAGGWGELRLGRDYVPTFWNMTVFDAFGTNGVGSNIGHKIKLAGTTAGVTFANAIDPNYVRANNMVAYFLPANLGGFYGQISYAFDEVPNSDQGQYVGGRLGFASGPFNVAAAYGRTDGSPALGFTSPAAPDVRNWNIGGQWDFGMAKLLGVYDDAKYDGGAFGTAKLKTWLIGGLIPVGAGEIRLSYGVSKLDTDFNDPKAQQWALGYVHNLSKRTALYATYAHVSNKDGAAVPINASINTTINGIANHSSSGFDIGIRHSF